MNIICIVLLCVFLQKLLNVYIIFTDPTEKVTIQVLSQSSTIKEGDNITLKCSGNGNPPPQEFLFYIPVSPASLSPCSEIFCIIPSYRHCYMSVYTWFYNKWRKESGATKTEDRHQPLHQTLRTPHLSWQNILRKPLIPPTPPEGFGGLDLLKIARLHFSSSDILIRR